MAKDIDNENKFDPYDLAYIKLWSEMTKKGQKVNGVTKIDKIEVGVIDDWEKKLSAHSIAYKIKEYPKSLTKVVIEKSDLKKVLEQYNNEYSHATYQQNKQMYKTAGMDYVFSK